LPNCGRPEGRPFQSAILSSHNFSPGNNFSLAQLCQNLIFSKLIFSKRIFSNAFFSKTHFSQNGIFLKTRFSQRAIFLKRISLKALIFQSGYCFKAAFQERSCEATRQKFPLNVPVTAQLLNL